MYIRLYKGDARAVMLNNSNRHLKDVIGASKETSKSTYFPFGIGIYEQIIDDKGRTKRGKLLPMFYVSHEVACSRSPDRHIHNPSGVREGWYVIGDKGITFEIAMTCMNKATFSYKDKRGQTYNTIRASLLMDGNVTSHVYDVDETSYRYEYTCKGMEGVRDNEINPFQFQKANVTEDMEDGDINGKIGTIELKVSRGNSIPHRYRGFDDEEEEFSSGDEWQPGKGLELRRAGRKRKRKSVQSTNSWTNDEYSDDEHYSRRMDCGKIHEKSAAKDGKSIRIGVSSKTIRQNASKGNRGPEESTVRSPQSWKEANIIIYIRESSWLRSRRIIDDEGNACTNAKYEQMMKSISHNCSKKEQVKEEDKIIRSKHIVKDFIDLT